MKKQLRFIGPIAVVLLAALGFAGWRTWGMHKGPLGGWPELDGGVYAEPVTNDGLKYLVPPDQVYDSGLTAEDRPALTDPKMDDVTTADTKLADDLDGIAVTVGGEHRFYPIQIMNWHEVVNDQVNGESLVITYSALTGSAVVYQDDRHFSDAGKVYNNALLMKADDDQTTLWNQTTGQAIVGDEVGDSLKIYPSSVMSWASWKDLHPQGKALSVETGYARDYSRHPYASYDTAPAIYFPLNHTLTKLDPKDLVYRVDTDDAPLIFMKRYLPMQTDPNAEIQLNGETVPIVALYDEDLDIVRVFDRRLDDRVLSFTYDGGKITDNDTQSRWSPNGEALSGEMRGLQLTEIPVTRHFAFAQFAMYPNTVISGEDLIPADDVNDDGGQTLQVN